MFNWLKNIFNAKKRRTPKPVPSPKPAPIPSPTPQIKKIKYLLNDPTTQDQILLLDPPQKISLKTNIIGYVGGGFEVNTPQGQAANCYVTINTIGKYLMSNITSNKNFNKWAAVSILRVNPRAGKDFNAFYDRHSLKFFYDQDILSKKMIYTSESSDVVAHEFGHAFLDILRPDLWSVQSYEAWAFHESFGDIVAICNIMQYDQILTKALADTGNDLKKSNIISRLAEELGKAISTIANDSSYALALRDAVNNFKYIDPKLLPADSPNNELSNECHNFSRVWTGAWYDCMIGMYIQNVQSGMSNLEALKLARDTAAQYVLYACQYADSIKFYSSTAAHMLFFDKNKNNGKYQNVLSETFSSRNIPIAGIKILGNQNYVNIVKKSDFISQDVLDEGFILKTSKVKTLTFNDGISAQSNSKKSFAVEVPCTSVYIFDKNKNLVHATENTEEETVEMVKMCVSKLESKNLIGDNDHQTFEVKDGKLVRKYISCRCHPNNACNPQAPEYGKPWKGQNNAGCGSKGMTVDCDCTQPTPDNPPKIGCYTTTKTCSQTSRVFCQQINRKVC